MAASTASAAVAGIASPTVCQMCLRVPAADSRFQLSQCGHQFCGPCVTAFVAHSVSQGRVRLRCPFDRALAQVLEGNIAPHARVAAATAPSEALEGPGPLAAQTASVPLPVAPPLLPSCELSTADDAIVAVADASSSPLHRKGKRTSAAQRAGDAAHHNAGPDDRRRAAPAGHRHPGQPSQPSRAGTAAASRLSSSVLESAPQSIDVLVMAEHDARDHHDHDGGAHDHHDHYDHDHDGGAQLAGSDSGSICAPLGLAVGVADTAGGSNCSADSCGDGLHRHTNSDRVSLLPSAASALGAQRPQAAASATASALSEAKQRKRDSQRKGLGQRHAVGYGHADGDAAESEAGASGSIVAAAISGIGLGAAAATHAASQAASGLHETRQCSAHTVTSSNRERDGGSRLARRHAVAAPSTAIMIADSAGGFGGAACGTQGRTLSEPLAAGAAAAGDADAHVHATGGNTICNAPIAEGDLRRALAGDTQGLARLERFTAMAADQHIRECPVPTCGHLQPGSPSAPAMTCARCGSAFCYFHANAHAGQPGPGGCAAYEAARASAPDAVATAALVRSEGVKQCPRW